MTTWAKCPSIEFSKDISYLVLSDIHLFHSQNPTESIIRNLFRYFDDFKHTSRFAKLDVIFIAGDIFDTLVYFKHADVTIVLDFFRRLMNFCAEHGIILRILEGTPSHDYKQAVNFQSIADAFGARLDYRYVQSLSIERIRDLNLSVLYVPDEWGGSAEECHRQVEELLETEGLEQVDIGIMHGMFEYQLPEVGKDPLIHNSDYYRSIVKYFINIGHVHTPSVHLGIIAQGSFDRIKHGEEEKKGAFLMRLRLNGEHSFEFIENKTAMIFKTVRILSIDAEDSAKQLHSVLATVPDNSHIRVQATKGAPIFAVLDSFKKEYTGITFKKDEIVADTNKKDGLSEVIDLNTSFIPISLPKESLTGMILKEINSKDQLSMAETALLVSELDTLHV